MWVYILMFTASLGGVFVGVLGGTLLEIHSYAKADAIYVDASKIDNKALMHMPLAVLAEFPISIKNKS